MFRALVCLIVVASWSAALPDATPPPPKPHAAHITLGGCDIEDVWRDDELDAILERGPVVDWLGDLDGSRRDESPEDLHLDPHLTDSAGAATAPPDPLEDVPLE